MAIPFPGILDSQERANLESVEYTPPTITVLRKFSFRDNTGTWIMDIKPNQMIVDPSFVHVSEAFDGSNPKLKLATNNRTEDIGHAFLGAVANPGLVHSISFYNIFTDVARLFYRATTDTGVPSVGAGWFFFTILDLNILGVK